MTTRFCHFCGHGPVEQDENLISCSDCHAGYFMGKIINKPTISEEEADLLFTKKELTDRQRYGTGVKRRRRV